MHLFRSRLVKFLPLTLRTTAGSSGVWGGKKHVVLSEGKGSEGGGGGGSGSGSGSGGYGRMDEDEDDDMEGAYRP